MHSGFLVSETWIPESNRALAGFRRSCFLFIYLFFFKGLSYAFIDAVVGGSKSDEIRAFLLEFLE